ncbi:MULTISPECIES: hypothetical protein [Methylococcus]|uniref:Transposase n=1 Tax=Methylococcus capsulatus TaxID=414 RepID=A0ABZ2F123_METCP|nr:MULTISPECIES: hypothetical protein [Methylococcus]MDF9393844.1 hypothetical protein [Methylococcus capsulatus]
MSETVFSLSATFKLFCFAAYDEEADDELKERALNIVVGLFGMATARGFSHAETLLGLFKKHRFKRAKHQGLLDEFHRYVSVQELIHAMKLDRVTH